jgi:hypothetical protein
MTLSPGLPATMYLTHGRGKRIIWLLRFDLGIYTLFGFYLGLTGKITGDLGAFTGILPELARAVLCE